MYKKDGSAASIYEALRPVRDNFLRRAEECAALTIPMLVPRNSEERIGNIQDFPTPRQGVGARGVNHLSSRLLLTLLPPGAPIFKYSIDAFTLDFLSQLNEKIQIEIKNKLAQIEDSVQREIETGGYRIGAIEIFKHLLVTGNVLEYLPKDGGLKFYPLYQYVAVRDPEGDEIIDIVLKETLDRHSLDPDLVALADASDDIISNSKGQEVNVAFDSSTSLVSEAIEIYTRQYRLEKNKFKVQQEFKNGFIIPGTEGEYKSDTVEYRALRWTAVPGEAYGRGFVEEYKGHLVALEGLSQALIEGALAAARLVGLIRPNSNTRAKDLNDAPNGSFVQGMPDDVKFLQIEKSQDFSTAYNFGLEIKKDLEQAFLLNSSVIRDAERVTAEEVRFVAQELETTLGGAYTVLANEFQLPLVKSILARLERKGDIPKFPPNLKNKIKPTIVTGVDALGRNAELDRIRVMFGTLQGIIGPEQTAAITNARELAEYIKTQSGVTVKGLIKSEEQMAQEAQQAQQQAAMQEVISKGTGPAINAVSKATTEANAPAEAPQGG